MNGARWDYSEKGFREGWTLFFRLEGKNGIDLAGQKVGRVVERGGGRLGGR